MLSKPEEFILAILAGLWVVLTYFLAAHINDKAVLDFTIPV